MASTRPATTPDRTALLYGLAGQLRGFSEVPGGYALTLNAAAAGTAAEWLAAEQRRCPDLAFSIEAGQGGDQVRVIISGPTGTMGELVASFASAGLFCVNSC